MASSILVWVAGLVFACEGKLVVKKSSRLFADPICSNWTDLTFDGRVIVGGSLETWNHLSNRAVEPCVVLEPFNEKAVREVVRFAVLSSWKGGGYRFRIHGGGHDYLTHSSWNGAVLTTRKLKSIRIDGMTIWIGAGCRWGEVYEALNGTSYYVAGGLGPGVGAAGFVLGGGVNHNYHRYHGLGVDNLVSARIVTADGRIVIASKDENEDLFWALRGGGGGGFGVVTQIQMRLVPDAGSGIQYFFHFQDALRIFRWIQTFALSRGPANDSRIGVDAHAFSRDDIKVTVQWNKMDDLDDFVQYLDAFVNATKGDVDWKIDRACSRLRLDQITSLPLAKLLVVTTQCSRTAGVDSESNEHKKGVLRNVAQTGDNWFVDSVDDRTISRALDVQSIARNELGARFIICLEFFFNCSKSSNTAFPIKNDVWFWYWECFSPPGVNQQRCDDLGTNLSLATSLSSTIFGSYANYPTDKYANFLHLFYGPSLPKLRMIKQAWDPTDFFSTERSIPPLSRDGKHSTGKYHPFHATRRHQTAPGEIRQGRPATSKF